ncbi:uncharacterized protein MJAP1_003032 [Malassezia japonica]|uniref:GDP/GTP exchange factor Sec2 N-terminal domain-containing protein n=1 Tax=Malassezia japonica TaxID=223818 RepID=A0AAF0JBA3_9BASI|nr:uncharacterized protein MJAP1_003032 [Malassezia japonica]WFD40050.1 hypothetical protein MJAP1_003032 [Malassezia japonica]
MARGNKGRKAQEKDDKAPAPANSEDKATETTKVEEASADKAPAATEASDAPTEAPEAHDPASEKQAPEATADVPEPVPEAQKSEDDDVDELSSPEPVREEPVDYLLQLNPDERERDLRNQVTSLNAKLVMSFNRVSDLEDDLSIAHNRILAYTTQIAELNKEREQHLFALNTGLLVEKAHVTTEMQRMMDRVLDETAQRGKAESDKTRIEAELEELSASLFNEANKMVAVERLERARAEEKSANLEESLRNTERIMAEQQDMLKSLQAQIEKGASSEEPLAISQHSAPESDALGRSVIHDTVVSINIQPYYEFVAFVEHLRAMQHQLHPYIRMQQKGLDWTTQPFALHASGMGISGVMSPAIGQATPVRHKDYPHLPSSAEQLVQISSQTSLPFIRRAQEEDTDPCLRLNHAPGLNWLSRRQATSAVLDGSLVIEPLFAGGAIDDEAKVRSEYGSLPPAPCALCGMALVNLTPLIMPQTNEPGPQKTSTTRRSIPSLFQSLRRSVASSDMPSPPLENETEIFSQDAEPTTTNLPIPTHYFRVSDSSNKYLVCSHHCLRRLRAVCGFWMFVRTLERAVVLEGKLAPDLVGGTRIADGPEAAPEVGPLDEPDGGAAEAHEAEKASLDAKQERAEEEKEKLDEEAKDEAKDEDEDVFDEAQEETSVDQAAKAEGGKADDAETATDADKADFEAKADEDKSKDETAGETTEKPLDPVSEPPLSPTAVAPSPLPPTLPARPLPPRHSFLVHAEKGTLTWEESLWAEILRLKEAMYKARTGTDLDPVSS